MKNKPVAWLWTKDGKPQSALLHEPDTVPSDPYWKDKGFKAIPLYTHPAKTLTDEEIDLIAGMVPTIPTGWDLIEFARAILRKAQEK